MSFKLPFYHLILVIGETYIGLLGAGFAGQMGVLGWVVDRGCRGLGPVGLVGLGCPLGFTLQPLLVEQEGLLALVLVQAAGQAVKAASGTLLVPSVLLESPA